MPFYNDVSTIVNKVTRQSLGESGITVTDTTSLVTLGHAVLSSAQSMESWYGALGDVIGLFMNSDRAYMPEIPDIIDYGRETGGAIRKVYIELPEMEKQATFDVADGTTMHSTLKIKKDEVIVRYIENAGTYEDNAFTQEVSLRIAFRSMEDMGAFINYQMLQHMNARELAKESAVNMALSTLIAQKCLASKGNPVEGNETTFENIVKGNHVKDILPLVRVRAGVPDMTAEQARTQYANITDAIISEELDKDLTKMARMSRYYNMGGLIRPTPNDKNFARHTPRNKARVFLLSDIAASLKTYYSVTYHDDLVRLPNYIDKVSWLGGGDSDNFADNSKVAITTTSLSNGNKYDITATNVIAMISDVESVVVNWHQEDAKTDYDPHQRVLAYLNMIECGYFVDVSENALVYTLGGEITVAKNVG